MGQSVPAQRIGITNVRTDLDSALQLILKPMTCRLKKKSIVIKVVEREGGKVEGGGF